MEDSFKNFLNFSKRKPNLIESGGGRQIVNIIFTESLKTDQNKR